MVDLTKAFVANPNTAEFPENWSRIYPYEWNAGYPTSTSSYTAADGGYPVGDLNWFPADKANWLINQTKSATRATGASEEIAISKIYPNPFVSEVTIQYELSKNQPVEISVYNSMGQKVEVIQSGFMNKGTHEVIWNGKGGNNPNEVFYFVISGASGRVSAKLIKQ